MNPIDLLILALAGYRLTRLLIEDEILSGLRDKFWERFPPESTKLGYLFTCYWCLGFWVSFLFVLLYVFAYPVMMVVGLILALSAAIGIIQRIVDR